MGVFPILYKYRFYKKMSPKNNILLNDIIFYYAFWEIFSWSV